MITATPEAVHAIKMFLAEKGLRKPIRIHLRSTGCCDASLGLEVDNHREDDWTQEIEGVSFAIGKDLERMTGDIAVSYSADPLDAGFIVTSEHPVSEWSGFGVCTIKSPESL